MSAGGKPVTIAKCTDSFHEVILDVGLIRPSQTDEVVHRAVFPLRISKVADVDTRPLTYRTSEVHCKTGKYDLRMDASLDEDKNVAIVTINYFFKGTRRKLKFKPFFRVQIFD